MHLKITILPGDGIGPEVTAQAERVLRTVEEFDNHEFEIAHHAIGGAAIASTGSPLPKATLEACLASDAVLLGAVGLASAEALPPAERPEAGLLALREALGAFANLRPAVAYEPLVGCSPLRPEVVAGADLLIVRELLGGLYYGTPRGLEAGAERVEAFNTMRYTEAEIERVARVAFEAARGRRRRLASVDKANVLETSRLWREVVTRVARDYPDVEVAHFYVDACAMHLVTNPTCFDVLLTENLFGDILSDEAAAIVGSLGMLPSASIGGRVGLYEPVHGSAPDLAGQNVANPLGAIASAAMLLRHSAGLEREASDVEEAIRMVLAAGYVTADLDADRGWRTVSTEEMGDLVVQAVAELADARYAWHAV